MSAFKILGICDYNSDSAQIWFLRSWKVYPETFFDLCWLGVLVLPIRTNLEIASSDITTKIGINFKVVGIYEYMSESAQISFLGSSKVYLETFFDLYRLGVSIPPCRTKPDFVSS